LFYSTHLSVLHGTSAEGVVKLDGLVGGDALLVYRALSSQPEVNVPSERSIAVVKG
jgi:hypothetical protein